MITAQQLFKVQHSNEVFEELKKRSPEKAWNMWKWFLALSEVPHGSGKLDQAIAWYMDIASKLNATSVKKDAHGNINMKFPATKGKENCPGVVLQAHIDMVCTKTADLVFNFEKDPIHMIFEGEWLKAHQTTLGGDDGIGVALCLAMAEDHSIEHGPLEILLTTDEEIGLIGACGLKEGELLSKNAKYLLNVDSEDWGEICVSCAGSCMRKIHIPVIREKVGKEFEVVKFYLKNLTGGHSGCEIHVGRGNALKWVMKMIADNSVVLEGTPISLVEFDGGNAHNAIPSYCTAKVAVPKEMVEKFIENAKAIFENLKTKFAKIEKKDVTLVVSKEEKPENLEGLTQYCSLTVLRAIEAFHHGVFKWSLDVPNLVETSQSLSIANLYKDEIVLQIFARSSVNESIDALSDTMEAMTKLYGGKVEKVGTDMPGWPANPKSTLLEKAKEVFAKQFKAEAKITKIHAGLECGIIINKYPENNMEAISLGPELKSPHSPDERLNIETANDMFTYVEVLLKEL